MHIDMIFLPEPPVQVSRDYVKVWWRYSRLKSFDIQSNQICQILWYNKIFLKFECVYNIFNIMKCLCNFQKIIWTFNEAIQTLGLALYRLIKKKVKIFCQNAKNVKVHYSNHKKTSV